MSSTEFESDLQSLYGLAREDARTFCEVVLKDQRSNQPITLAPMHEQWHRLLDKHDRLVILAHIESGKTSLLSVGRVLYELARDPAMRILILSNTARQAQTIVSLIKQYIESSAELHAIAPDLKPGLVWRDDSITVARAVRGKDFSVVAAGRSANILGARYDLVIVDDYDDAESTQTEVMREGAWNWLQSTPFTRFTDKTRVVVVATAWHNEDCAHRLTRQGWPTYRFPVINKETGDPHWPEKWSLDRIARWRFEKGPFESARTLDLNAIDDSTALLQSGWLANALFGGDGLDLVYRYTGQLGEGHCVVGVDLGVGLTVKHDLTSFATIFVKPDGVRRLLSVESGHWDVTEIAAKLKDHFERYRSPQIIVESVAAQGYVLDLVRKTKNIPCTGYRTAGGLNSLPEQAKILGNELHSHRWQIPNKGGQMTPEIRALVQEMLAFRRGDHCGDRLSSLLMARWGADRAAGRFETGNIQMTQGI